MAIEPFDLAAAGMASWARSAVTSARASLPVVALSLALVLVPWRLAVAAPDDRPNENEMFGGGPTSSGGNPGSKATGAGGHGGAAAEAPASPPAPTSPSAETRMPPAPAAAGATPATPPGSDTAGAVTERDTALLGDPNAGPRLSQDVAAEDPLRIGGQVYLRALSQATQGQAARDIRFSAPSLVDGYFDARPNDRVRGFVLGRLQFDSTLPSTGTSNSSGGLSSMMPSSGSALAVPLLSGVQNTRGPSAVLDQLWLRFDILRTVFVTAGRQHVKWGTARFWTPTDYLHPQRRNPVAVFDARPGFTMLKLHLPWEARAWNFYAFGLVEGVKQLDLATGRYPDGSDGAGTLGQLGGAARAEVVVGTAELGLDTVLYRGRRPKFGADLSFGIGDFDLYADAGLRFGSELLLRTYEPADVPITNGQSLDQWLDLKYPRGTWSGVKPQITVGGTYQFKYNDNDVFTVTGEYFYNSVGYDDPRVYPVLFLTGTFEFFYTGRHYAALAAVAAAPWSWNYTTFTFSTLGNLSDQSFISRLDYSLIVLTHLRFEAFGAVNFGRQEGEFRLGVNNLSVPADPASPDQTPRSFSLAPQSFSLGLGLRISI